MGKGKTLDKWCSPSFKEEFEDWADLLEFPNHQVSSYGRVRNKRTGHILKPFSDKYGYLRMSIGNVDNVYIHRLVCKTFLGPPEEGQTQVNHIDGNRQNNNVLNLEWCTPSENIKWAVHKKSIDMDILSRKALSVNLTPVRIVETGTTFSSVKECAEYLNVSPTNVSRVLIGERKGQRIHGYHIEYI